jgi:hypothetical protein
MAIKRYTANADNTITTAFKNDLLTRATKSNAGLADSLETFSIFGQANSSSIERARILISFPISDITSDRTAGTIPAADSVSFYLKMYNVKHSQTLPKNFTLQVYALSQDWDEGRGVDLDSYTDLTQSNWVERSPGNNWTVTGGTFHDTPKYTATFTEGNEDLSIDITTLVEQWIAGTKTNYGVMIKISGSGTPAEPESDGDSATFYTKRFSSRSSEFFFKRPVIQAQWDSRTIDERNDFYYSSSLAPAADNVHTLYLYNYVRGKLQNIPGVAAARNEILVSLYSGTLDNTKPSGSKLVLYDGNYNITGGLLPGKTGIYTCSIGITASDPPLTHLFDVWHSSSQGSALADIVAFHTGTIIPIVEEAEVMDPATKYVLSLTNLKSKYYTFETARFRLFTRQRDWNPTVYSKATANISGSTIRSSSYSVYRTTDDLECIPFGTGSDYHTFLSYDKSGSYFDLDMGMLEPGYQYAIKFSFYNDSVGAWQEQPYRFKFRVEDV